MKKQKGKKLKVHELFGITEEKADKIIATINIAYKLSETWEGLYFYAKMGCNIEDENEAAYFGYIIGSLVQKNKAKEALESML